MMNWCSNGARIFYDDIKRYMQIQENIIIFEIKSTNWKL